jgi:hypothetical protein
MKEVVKRRTTCCPGECDLEALIWKLSDFLSCVEGDFNTSKFISCLHDTLQETGILDISSAVVISTRNTLRVVISFPPECCSCFDVFFMRSMGKVLLTNNCSSESPTSLTLPCSQTSVVTILYSKPGPCKERRPCYFEKPKVKTYKRRKVECEESEESSEDSLSEECEIQCVKCRKVCGCSD